MKKKYTKPELFFGIIIIIVSFVISGIFFMPAVENYIPVLSLWEDPYSRRTLGDLIVKDSTGNANKLLSLFTVAFWVYTTFTIFFIINIFKKKFAINALKIIFGYPWQPYYSFWLFWLIGFPFLLNILWIILDGLRYLILSNFEIPYFISVIISVILFIVFVKTIAGTIIYLKKK